MWRYNVESTCDKEYLLAEKVKELLFIIFYRYYRMLYVTTKVFMLS